MFKVTAVGNTALTREYAEAVTLIDAARDFGLRFDAPCGGKGFCGKCRCAADGGLSAVTAAERAKLTEAELNGGTRLLCQAAATGEARFELSLSGGGVQGVTASFKPREFDKDPLTGGEPCLGLALDIGTTTIAGYLYRLPECEFAGAVCVPNSQAKFGADVISRIEYANGGGLKELQSAILADIEEVKRRLGCDESNVTTVVAGNTVMLHLLAGLEPRSLAVAPFTPVSLFGDWRGNAYFVRCASAYVGADIVAGLVSLGLNESETAFYVDIGTNGEMALWQNGKVVCCSTAAGPVFEGASISNGCMAVAGAIDKVYSEGNALHYTTISNAKPVGVCGTGLIDAVACMLELGVLEPSGFMENDFEIGDSGVIITRADIRQIQLAKAAIRAGIDTLLETCGVTCAELDAFIIAGGFGSFINVSSAAKIGMIPLEAVDKAVSAGNASGLGASMILRSRTILEESEGLARLAETVELSENPGFMDRYVDCMYFGRGEDDE